jgi:phosphoribosylaminoimidazolecarboxamide formyltransferase/IMP cyclohydrolase
MVRAAAKNHARVAVVVDPTDYPKVQAEIEADGVVSHATRVALAAKAFAHTAAYDGAIAGYLSGLDDDGGRERFPRSLHLGFERAYSLRYGENPHQQAAFYRERRGRRGHPRPRREPRVRRARSCRSTTSSTSTRRSRRCVSTTCPAAVVVKHCNPCGVAVGATLVEASYRAAREADAVSAFGGIVALNDVVDEATAKALAETFLEVVAAPGFDDAALAILRAKKNLRLLSTRPMAPCRSPRDGDEARERRSARAGPRRDRQGRGAQGPGRDEPRAHRGGAARAHLRVGGVQAREEQRDRAGARRGGRPAHGGRRGRADVAGDLGGHRGPQGRRPRGRERAGLGRVLPLPDGLERAAEAGVRAVAQPGGSVRDEEVIAAADRADIAMVFTAVRHFRH